MMRPKPFRDFVSRVSKLSDGILPGPPSSAKMAVAVVDEAGNGSEPD
ncbi:MAG TPA: hypothetical protein VGB71_03490 [Flavisolibacter sp.]